MIKNYFKLAWRSLKRNRAFSVINISGLAVGMAAAILIGIWVQNELSYDRFYSDQSNLYKLINRTSGPDNIGTWDITSGPVGKALKTDFPEIKNSARIYWTTERLFNYGDKSIKAKGNDVDKPFLTLFDFPMVAGNRQHAFDDIHNIVLTKSLAKSLFGNDDPMNKIIQIDNKEGYKVSGVLENLPNNTEFDFTYLVSLEANENRYSNNSWDNYTYYTYVQTRPGLNLENFNKKIKGETIKHLPTIGSEVFLYPVSKMHLYSRFENGKVAGGKIETVRLLIIIGSLILLIACINFMNLSTAQSQRRAKEVGVRKVAGAGKGVIITQFLSESILIAVIAGVLALVIVQLALPSFNQLINKSLSLHFDNPWLWVALAGFILFTGLLAGSYPAFFLSAFKPVRVLKGALKDIKTPFNPRKILVVTQFSAAIILIVATLVIYRQIRFVQDRDAGYRLSNLVEVPIEGNIMKNYEAIKADLLNSGAAQSVCKNSLGVTVDGRTQGGYSWEGSSKEKENLTFSRTGTDGDFVKTLGLKLLEGRDIDFAEYPADTASVLLNETAVKQMEIKDPVGKYIKEFGQPYTIVGVFKDFIIGSPYDVIKPMIVVGTKYWEYHLVVRLNGQKGLTGSLHKAELVFKKYNPAYPFTYHFIDQQYAEKFSEQKQTGSLAGLFAGLTIFISCLGLFGLAAYMAQTRAKEIGVRKVLGASVAQITAILSFDFVKLVLISIVIATPVAIYAMNKWLQDFSYRIHMNWIIFFAAGVIAVLIALFTVSFQAIKAAVANPVKSLRTE